MHDDAVEAVQDRLRVHNLAIAFAALVAILLAVLALPSLASAQTPGQFNFIGGDPSFGSQVVINRVGGGTTTTEPSRFDVTVTSNGTVHVPGAAFCVDLDVGMTAGQVYDVLIQTGADAPELNDANYGAIAWLLARTPGLIDAAADKGLEAGALQLAVWMHTPGEADPTDPIQPTSAREVALEARAIALYNEAIGKSLTTLTISANPASALPGTTVALNLTGTPGTSSALSITSGSGTLGAGSVTFDSAGQASTTLSASADGQVTVQATTQAGELRRVVEDPNRPPETPEVQSSVYLVPASASTTVTFATPPPPPPVTPVTPASPPVTPPTPPVTPVSPANTNVCLRPNLRVQVMGTRRPRAGNAVKYKVKLTNRSRVNVAEMVSVRITVPRGYSVVRRPRGSTIRNGDIIVPIRDIAAGNGMRMTMVTLRADRTASGRAAVRAFASAKCSRRRAGTLGIRTRPLIQRVSPAVTG